MKRLTFIIVLLSVAMLTNVKAQIMPDTYDGVPQSNKVRIFMDNFDSNKYFWIKNTSPATHQIIDGYFMFSNDYAFSYTDGKPISFDGTKNFEIETRIKFVSGDVEMFSGLFWGELVFGDKYFLGFSSMGSYKIDKETGFQASSILDPVESQIINSTAENTLTVRKYDNKYYFFINQNLVHTMDYEDLPGQYIGFTVAEKSIIQINFLRLWYIE